MISDWAEAVEDTAEAAMGGLDVEMPRPEHFGRRLVKAVEDGRVPEGVVDEAASRVVREKLRFDYDPARYGRDMVASREHTTLAREAARKGMVLLKNEGGALPLTGVGKLVVTGGQANMANIGDLGSSVVTPPYKVSPLQGIRELTAGSVEVVHVSGKLKAAAKDAAASADAVVVVAGLDHTDEGEGNDREDLRLHKPDRELIKAVSEVNERVIVVMQGGSSITVSEWKDKASAIVMAWYPGMEGGHAIAEALFGEVNPSGKLPVIFPKDKSQFHEFDNKAKQVHYEYLHGYRHFQKSGLEPEWPFGFGLSYTTFACSGLSLGSGSVSAEGEVRVSVDVENTGAVAGEEVVQVYAGFPEDSKVERAPKELAAFARVALEPGEKKTVQLSFPVSELAFYDVESNSWVVEPGSYKVFAGSSSDDKDLMATELTIKA